MANRKDKIKNIAIIFLLIMLVLTFFSNTIMNYSLVEVSTQQITSGSITSKVRGSGTVAASDSYNVTISETRKVATVNVKTNATVEVGDVLFTLEDAESTELSAAKKALTDAQAAYETAVLAAGITVAERQSIEAGKGSSLTEKQNAIAAATQKVTDCQAAADAAAANVSKVQTQIDALGSTTVDTSAEDLAVLNAQKNLTAATDSLNVEGKLTAKTSAEDAYNAAVAENDKVEASNAGKSEADKVALPNSAEKIATLKKTMTDATNAYNTAKASYDSYKAALDTANYNLSVKKLSGTNTAQTNTLQKQLTDAKTAQTAADTALATAKTDLETIKNKIDGQVTIASAYATYMEAKETAADLESKAIGAEITSPIAGTVTGIDVTAGNTVNANDTMMEIQPENKAFTLEFSVSANQAKKVKAGDTAEVVNNWYGNDITARVLNVHKDPNNKTSSIVSCEMSGDVAVGDNYTLSIGEQSANYDLIVPTSAIREDSNGSFILIIESKSTPLGNRYYARRVDVEIVTSDDTKSAVTGALEGYEFVITTTTKPVAENQQVRLAE